MKTYAELNRENQQLKEKLKITELSLEAEKENRKVVEAREKEAIEFLKENADYTGKDFVSDLRYDECLKLLKILIGELKPEPGGDK